MKMKWMDDNASRALFMLFIFQMQRLCDMRDTFITLALSECIHAVVAL